MKIRNGFVSNSSSSSFILVGMKLEPKSILKNPMYKIQFDKKMEEEQRRLNEDWEKILNHPDYNKFKSLFDNCKSNNVSIPQEVNRFFGRGFTGVFEARKPDEKGILYDMMYEGGFEFPKGIEVMSDDGTAYLGRVLVTSSDDYLDNGSISMSDMIKYTKEISDLGFDEKDVKVYYGTRAS